MRFPKRLILAVVTAACVQQTSNVYADPQQDASTQPQAKWVLDQSGYYCALAAKLNGQVNATMVLRTLPGTWVYDFSLVGDGFPKAVLVAHNKAGIVLLPSGTSETGASDETIIDRGRMLVLPSVSSKFLTAFGKSAEMAIAVDGAKVLRVALPASADAAMDALNDCIIGKLTDSGADPAGFQSGGSQPKEVGDESKWLDMPPMMSMGNAGIHVAARLDIGPDGKASDCGVLELVGRLNRDTICRNLMERARYEPARDPQGKPIKAVVVFELNEQYRSWMTLEN